MVSIRTEEVQNRVGRVVVNPSDAWTDGNSHRVSNNLPLGSSYIVGPDFSVPGHTFKLQKFEVLRDGTDDEDPIWITATFEALNDSISWTAYWEGEFEQFHTIFLRWYDQTDSTARTYTLPLRSAAKEGGIQRNGSWVSFVWIRTHKEFERRGLDLANHRLVTIDMLALPVSADIGGL